MIVLSMHTTRGPCVFASRRFNAMVPCFSWEKHSIQRAQQLLFALVEGEARGSLPSLRPDVHCSVPSKGLTGNLKAAAALTAVIFHFLVTDIGMVGTSEGMVFELIIVNFSLPQRAVLHALSAVLLVDCRRAQIATSLRLMALVMSMSIVFPWLDGKRRQHMHLFCMHWMRRVGSSLASSLPRPSRKFARNRLEKT